MFVVVSFDPWPHGYVKESTQMIQCLQLLTGKPEREALEPSEREPPEPRKWTQAKPSTMFHTTPASAGFSRGPGLGIKLLLPLADQKDMPEMARAGSHETLSQALGVCLYIKTPLKEPGCWLPIGVLSNQPTNGFCQKKTHPNTAQKAVTWRLLVCQQLDAH